MSSTSKVLIGILTVLVVALLGGALVVRSMLSGSGKDKIVAALAERLGVSLKVGRIDASLPRVLTMTPALSLGQIELGNPPGFSSKPMVVAQQINTRLELASVFSGTPRVIALEIVRPAISMETDAQGRTNLQVFMDGLSRRGAEPAPGAPGPKDESASLAIENLTISGGTWTTAGQPYGSWGDIQIKLNGFGTGRPLRAVASAALTGARVGRVELTGQMGPFTGAAMPLEGRLKVGLEPGGRARLDLDAELKGDLSAAVSGPAKLMVTDYPVGTNAQRLLPLNGEADCTVTVKQALGADPAFDVLAPAAGLALAGGQLNSRIAVSSRRDTTTGALAGTLSGLRIEQLLGAFSTGNPGVQGELTMPRFQVSFSGRNANEMLAALAGDGQVAVEKGKLPRMELLGAITGAIDRTGLVVTGGGGTAFVALRTDFAIAREVVELSNLEMEGAGLKAAGGGTVGLDNSLNLRLATEVGGRVAELLGARASGDGPARVSVPVEITGTTENPQVMPNVKGVARDAAKRVLGGALGKFLGGRK